MAKATMLKINNSKNAAVSTGKWSNPGAKFYDILLDAFYFPTDEVDNPDNLYPADFIKEAYLIAPIKDIKNSPYCRTPFSRSGCKYPHHSIVNGELVVNVAGIKAAYSRAKQMGEFKGEVKEHLVRHYKELGMYEDSNISAMESIIDNSDEIDAYIQEAASALDKNFSPKGSISLGDLQRIQITEDLIAEYKTRYPCLRHVRCKDTKEYTCDGYCWFKDDDLVCMVGSCTYRDTGEVYIVSLEVLDDHKGYGLAKQILSYAINEMHCTKLSVNKNNELAMKIYKRFGFRQFYADDTMIYMEYNVSDQVVNNHFVCISENDLDGKAITPRVPDNYMTKSGYEDNKTPRICFCPSISQCLTALAKNVKGKQFYVYTTIEQLNYYDPTIKEVPDSLITGEVWVKEPVTLRAIAKIECTGPTNDNAMVYTYGNGKKASLYRYSYKIIESDSMKFDKALSVIGGTPLQLSQWMKSNLSYDKAIKEWHFKTPVETLTLKKGNCHDQAAFAEYVINQMNTTRFKAQRLFFIEYNDGSIVGGNSHTLCYYIDNAEKNIYWIENAWETHAGIHGPYKTIDELKNDVVSVYKTDDDVNSHHFEFIAFGNPNYTNFGMTLGEYVNSCVLETDSNDEPKGYRINDEIEVKESTLYLEDNHIKLPLPALKYDPPLSADEVLKKYGKDTYESLSKDPAHAWRMKTGIELIHQEPTLEELDRICSNWQAMPNILKQKSDEKCKELFGFINLDYYKHLRKNSYSEKTDDDVSTEEDILKLMDDIEYGWYSEDDNKIHGTGLSDDENYFYKHYKLSSPKSTMAQKCGVCWDQTELERYYFNKMNINHAIIYIEACDGANNPSHTFAIIEKENGYYWFEHSWAKYRGIHKYIRINELIRDVINRHASENNISADAKFIVKHLVDTPKYSISCDEYMKFAHSQPSIDLVDIGNELFNESVSDTDQSNDSEESLPKQADKAENNKNGVERKQLYMEFIEYAKGINNKNTFGSVFDKMAFKTTYTFVPHELRYFYRLANPLLCVLENELTFFSLAELGKINKDNPHRDKMLIFASNGDSLRVFNSNDKLVYKATEEQLKSGKLVDKIGASFDSYIEKIIGKKVLTVESE